MRVLGIVVEYNPFHFGHLYHLKRAKEKVEPDFVVAVMSGNFCQRGEPAIVDKFARTEIALRMGVDVVFELPAVFAVQDAGGFAKGAISVLDATGVVTDVVFGSESDDVEFLKRVATILHEQPKEYQEFLRVELKKGYSFPNARKYALMRYFSHMGWDPSEVSKLEKSNDILGLEYIRSALEINSTISFHTIKRVGTIERDPEFKGKYSSATAIRNLIRKGSMEELKEALPKESYEVLMREMKHGRGPVLLESMGDFLLGFFRLKDEEYFSRIHGFSEGLEKRFVECAVEARSYREFLECVKSKRFTFSRLRRIALFAVFGLEKEFVDECNRKGPQYLRLLGFTEKGKELLKVIKKRAKLPLITNLSLYKKILEKSEFSVDKGLFLKQLELDVKATNLYRIFLPAMEERKGDVDFYTHPIFLSSET